MEKACEYEVRMRRKRERLPQRKDRMRNIFYSVYEPPNDIGEFLYK
jgi:hypothetical protein